MAEITPFTFVNEINHGKNDIMVDDQVEKLYNPFLVNRALSYFRDTVLLANEMNVRHGLDKKMQFDFLRLTTRKKKRYSKWNKATKSDNVDLVVEYWGYTREKAEKALQLLSEEQIERVRSILSKGGKAK